MRRDAIEDLGLWKRCTKSTGIIEYNNDCELCKAIILNQYPIQGERLIKVQSVLSFLSVISLIYVSIPFLT